MTERSRFFNSYGADVRQYSAADFAQVFARFLKNGVIKGAGNELAVTAGSGVQVLVDTGEGMVQGYWYQNDASKPINLAAADPTNPRVDLIVMRLDLQAAARTVTVVAKAGVPAGSPSAPALQQDSSIWEEALAQVRVAAVTGALTITDARTKVSAGGEEWVTGVDTEGSSLVRSSTVPNGVLTAFNVGAAAGGTAAKKVRVYVNCLRREQGTDFTFTEGEAHVDFLWTPQTGDIVDIEYVAV